MGPARSATLATLRARAALLARARAFFAARGVLEVDTPALSPGANPDAAIEPVRAQAPAAGLPQLYLHTSPEFAMKRLLAGGSGDIYQICRVFRDGEQGRWHECEFLMLEWYRVGWDELRLADEVAELLADLIPGTGPAQRIRYADAVRAALGAGPDTPAGELARALAARGIDVPDGLDRDALLDLAIGTVVAPGFAPDELTVLHDFPPSQAALAALKPTRPPVAARFELFHRGIELANGFGELTDAAEQRMRFAADGERRRRAGRDVPLQDEAFLAALDAGLPSCAGVAVGLDRVVALALGFDTLAPALAFTQGGTR